MVCAMLLFVVLSPVDFVTMASCNLRISNKYRLLSLIIYIYNVHTIWTVMYFVMQASYDKC